MLKLTAWIVLFATHGLVFAGGDDGKASTRSVCTSRCVAASLAELPQLQTRYGARMEALAAQQQAETDPAKKAALAGELAELSDKAAAAQEKSCKFICRNNPDE